MKTISRFVIFLLAMFFGCVGWAADVPGLTARVRLIAGQASEKGYIPRLEAIRALAWESPLSADERGALMAFLGSTDVSDGLSVMERASLKNEVAERFLRLPETSVVFARDLLAMQADPAQSPVWRNYCIQFLGRSYTSATDPALRKEVRERLYALSDAADPETCGTALIALASLKTNAEIDASRVASRSLALAKDVSQSDGLRLTALPIAAELGRPEAVPLARVWLANAKSANLRAAAIGVLGRYGDPSDRARIRPFLSNPDPRLNGAARAALGVKKTAGKQAVRP